MDNDGYHEISVIMSGVVSYRDFLQRSGDSSEDGDFTKTGRFYYEQHGWKTDLTNKNAV